ncbi:TRAP transporter substrate-binding protein [Gelria sp. Kuro-4]|uniref:TRAP transporter substrate-binding protein n=1 Tax=Gelria sp. Kuro-4 TaxID=2796927 RepID=UPI001BF02442|nr:TRAP transporter substrate-binding protein [Gelria sp. Kuro-4]BCV23516.1 sialic acid-binding protein [Gelria sp. Kuro-4]
MRKAFTLFVSLVLTGSLVLLGCQSTTPQAQQASSTTVLRLANVSPVGDVRDLECKKFADLVSQKTGGKVKVEVFSGGTLGDWRETIEGLKAKSVQVVLESVGTLDAYDKYADIEAVPFLIKDSDHYSKVWNGDIGKEILETVGSNAGFQLMGPAYRGARYVTSKKKVASVNDLKGLKIRVPNIAVYVKTWEQLGASPTPMAFTEIYTALQQGTVDAQENPLSENWNSAFYEVCPYLIGTKHIYGTDVFIMDREYFKSLDPEVQAAIQEAANEAASWRTQEVLKTEKDYLDKFKSKGITYVEVNRDEFVQKLGDFVGQHFPHLKPWADKITQL